MKRRQRFRKILKYSAFTLTVNWMAALIVFFANPAWAKEQLNKCFNFEVSRKIPFVKRVKCENYESVAWKLNNDVAEYWEHSSENGIPEPKLIKDIRSEYHKGNLVLVEPTDRYNLDTMYYSYAFTTPKAKQFIDTMLERFQAKLINTDLHGVKVTLTSLLRTRSSVDRLRKKNKNAVKNSTHMHGTTFDISYATYDFKRPVTPSEAEFLREVLAKTLFELRDEKKCWVKYEIFQTCFHVVAA